MKDSHYNKPFFAFVLKTKLEIIKIYFLIRYARKNKLKYYIIHTNQHYNANMDAIFFKELKLSKDLYFLLTHHRPLNTDNQKNFKIIIKTINKLCEKEKIKCILPIHPKLNSKKFVSKFKNILVIEFLGYLALLNLQKHSKMIFTDSGEIQKESCILKKKCVILRTNTKRPETVKIREAVLLKSITKEEILKQYNQLIKK
jgi:UDP-N-acetylglucosamine 2-epimerase (non-hydrolysing)